MLSYKTVHKAFTIKSPIKQNSCIREIVSVYQNCILSLYFVSCSMTILHQWGGGGGLEKKKNCNMKLDL